MKRVSKIAVRRSQGDWQILVAEQEKSGLTQKAFCQQRNLHLQSFRTRKWQMAQPLSVAKSASSPTWIELPLVDDNGMVGQTKTAQAAKAADAGWDIELQLGAGLCLRLRQRGC